jgi:4-amino-4-deoxy-L-arabinose transferase-like glycosyltransferase
LFEPDEGRYAEIPREMLVRGEWIIPYLQGQPYLDKPPLFYWLVMGVYRLVGVHDRSARLVPALAVHVSILLTYLLGRRSLGERAAFYGALALSLAPGFISVGRLLVLDGVLALWVTISLLCAFEALRKDRLRWTWWLVSAVAAGLGVLTKGPVALLLVAPPLAAQAWLSGSLCWPGGRGFAGYAGAVCLVAMPWYFLVWSRMPTFGSYFFLKHNLMRFLVPFDHQEPVWFYGPILLGGLLPGTLLLFVWIRYLFSSQPQAARSRTPDLGFMLLAGAWCVFFFSLAGCKLPTYILPAFPPLALAIGHFYATTRWHRSGWSRGVIAASVSMLAVIHYVAIPWYARFHSPMSQPNEVRQYCGDPATPVVCYPRNCDSVAFYLGRDDLRNYRSKETPALIEFLVRQPRTILLFTHRHSPDSLRHALPAGMCLTGLVPISRSWANAFRTEFCYMGIVERLDSAR